MNSNNALTWQLTFVMVSAIVVFGGGMMALLVLGRDVPAALWAVNGGLVNALVANGGFFSMRQMHAASLWHLAQAGQSPSGTVIVPTSGTMTLTTGSEEHKP